jgi:N-acylneuraminate cytidylyltransferase
LKKQIPGDTIFILSQITCPLTTSKDYEGALNLFKNAGADSVLSAARIKRFLWTDDGKPLNYNYKNRPLRQNFTGVLMENGAFYINTVSNIIYNKNRLSGDIKIYEMPEYTAIDIDEVEDWIIAENLMRKYILKEMNYQRINVVFTDCDGVLTDGGMYYSEKGDELKKFNTRDGIALKKLQGMGIKTGIITGEEVELVKWRAKKLGMDFCFTGVKDKLDFIIKFCNENNIEMSQIAYIGDEINDIDLLSKAGIAACPSDAASEVKAIPGIIILNNPGGSGVLKEFSEIILNRQNSLS